MQNGSAIEMSTAVDERHSIPQVVRCSFPELNVRIIAHDPCAVSRVQVDGRIIEGVAPFHHGRIEMGMRNGDGPNPTETMDPIDCLIVEQGHAIPQEISAGRLDEQGTLSDGKGRFSPDPDQIGRERRDRGADRRYCRAGIDGIGGSRA